MGGLTRSATFIDGPVWLYSENNGDGPGAMKERVHSLDGSPIPRFRALRRVPPSYRSVLPLKVMKRYQCLVVGGAQDALTVAITDRQDTSILPLLRKLTGRVIFPVWVDPFRMRLLIRRLERSRNSGWRRLHRLSPHQIGSMVRLLAYQNRG